MSPPIDTGIAAVIEPGGTATAVRFGIAESSSGSTSSLVESRSGVGDVAGGRLVAATPVVVVVSSGDSGASVVLSSASRRSVVVVVMGGVVVEDVAVAGGSATVVDVVVGGVVVVVVDVVVGGLVVVVVRAPVVEVVVGGDENVASTAILSINQYESKPSASTIMNLMMVSVVAKSLIRNVLWYLRPPSSEPKLIVLRVLHVSPPSGDT
jgi:hypothetical protein